MAWEKQSSKVMSLIEKVKGVKNKADKDKADKMLYKAE